MVLYDGSNLLGVVVREPEKEIEVYKADREVEVITRECLLE